MMDPIATRTEWADANWWVSLASERSIRLPQWRTRATPRKLGKWHRKLSNVPFSDVYGCGPTKLIELNPGVPLRVFVGQMLENAR